MIYTLQQLLLTLMQVGITNSINITEAFGCRLCKKIALLPLQNQCCTIIICDTCIGTNCYYCKRPCVYKKSPFLQHLYKCITIMCPFKCPANLSLFMLKEHMASCPQATMECPFCKDKNIKTSLFPQHMGEKHEQECSRLLLEFHKPKGEVKGQVPNKTINPFVLGTSSICKYGRVVCGGDLGTTANFNVSSGLFANSNKKLCSLQAGSCNKCMKKDKQRLRLPHNFILNFAGRICTLTHPRKLLGCGIGCGSNGNPFICNGNYACNACQATMQLVNKGLYRQFLSF